MKLLSRETTIRHLTRYQKWRSGQIEEFSKKHRTPDPKLLTTVIDSAIFHLKHFVDDVWTPK